MAVAETAVVPFAFKLEFESGAKSPRHREGRATQRNAANTIFCPLKRLIRKIRKMECAGTATICMTFQSSVQREQALTAIVEKYRTRLLSFIRARLRDQSEAEDVLQDVFAEFVEAYDLGEAIEKVSAWLARVAQNKILDRFRRQKIQSEYRESALATDRPEHQKFASRPDEQWMRTWLRAEIVNALEMLPDDQRDVFVKHELEGRTFAEIAAESGVGMNTLLSRKRYAVLFLRNQLKEIYDELE